MATRALSADALRASPGKFSEISASRRSFAAFAVGGIAAAAAFPQALASPITPALRPWDRLISKYETALAADAKFDREVYAPGHARLCAQIGEVPPRDFVLTARNGTVGHYPVDRGEDQIPWGKAFDPARQMAREFAAFRERTNKLEAQAWWLEIEEQSDRLNDVLYRAEQAILLAPAPDGAALARKVLILFDRRGGDVGEDVEAVMKADAKRLA